MIKAFMTFVNNRILSRRYKCGGRDEQGSGWLVTDSRFLLCNLMVLS